MGTIGECIFLCSWILPTTRVQILLVSWPSIIIPGETGFGSIGVLADCVPLLVIDFQRLVLQIMLQRGH